MCFNTHEHLDRAGEPARKARREPRSGQAETPLRRPRGHLAVAAAPAGHSLGSAVDERPGQSLTWPPISGTSRVYLIRATSCRTRDCGSVVCQPPRAGGLVLLGGSSSAGARPSTIASMSHRCGRRLAQGPPCRVRASTSSTLFGRCCFASRSGTAADAASASRRTDLGTTGAMQHFAPLGSPLVVVPSESEDVHDRIREGPTVSTRFGTMVAH